MRTFAAISLLGLFLFSNASSHAADPVADPKLLTAQTERVLASYNRDDAKNFYSGWTKLNIASATPQTYELLYKNTKKELGLYKANSLVLLKDESLLTGTVPLLIYEAKFAKNVTGRLMVGFEFEDGKFKVSSFHMDKKP
jgi:hypothetical protein